MHNQVQIAPEAVLRGLELVAPGFEEFNLGVKLFKIQHMMHIISYQLKKSIPRASLCFHGPLSSTQLLRPECDEDSSHLIAQYFF